MFYSIISLNIIARININVLFSIYFFSIYLFISKKLILNYDSIHLHLCYLRVSLSFDRKVLYITLIIIECCNVILVLPVMQI